MKKPVLIIIAIIYIMALVIVGLLGIPAKVVAPKVWTSDIELTFDDKLMPLKATEEIIESIKNNEFEITPSQMEITKAVTSSSRARCQYCEHRNICYRKGYDPLKDYSKIIKDKLLDMEVK